MGLTMAFELKRFWDGTSASQVEGGFAILLDQRPLKTPLKNPVIVPTAAFAEKIAHEWAAVDGKIQKHQMPFTRFAEAALDAAASEHAEIVDNLTGYGETDLLCYRAETPIELITRQAENWDSLLDWAAHELAAPLNKTQGIMAINQPRSSIQKLRECVENFDLFQLTAFYDLVKISGSLVIALAVSRNHIDAATGWQRSRVDDVWQIEQWGSDDEAKNLAESRQRDFENADLALSLLTK